jgi:protocatechuate 3,4-dioxygenase beta subunit
LLSACATGSRRRGPAPDATPEQTEGPYYRLFSDERAVLREDGTPGTPLVLAGRVRHANGKPFAHALLDFWHCDDAGAYDLRGSRLRGHQWTDADGHYELTTIVPGLYPGRTRHVHVKLQPAGADVPDRPPSLTFTTQLYFPGEPRNASDDLYDPRLLLAIERDGAGKVAQFDFVLDPV